MTDYTFHNGDINNGEINVGYIVQNIPHYFDCMMVVKNTLESYGHTIEVRMFIKKMASKIYDPFIRDVEHGYYISGRNTDLNYAFFSKEMNCAKSCVKAVLDVIL